MAAQNHSKSFYVYVHKRKTDGSVFYVGKGTRSRATKRRDKNPHWDAVVAKHGLDVEIVISGVQEWYAFELERDLIAYYGREKLCNMTDGGDGISGYSHSERAKQAISRAQTGTLRSAETRAKMSASQKGHAVRAETRRLLSESLRGRTLTAEMRAAVSAGLRGKKRSPEACASISNGQWRTPVLCHETGEVFAKMTHAVNWLKKNNPKACHAAVYACCTGKAKSAYGYHWSYAGPPRKPKRVVVVPASQHAA